ncbi:MAG: metal-dependent hydrolase [bacterium]
MDTPTQALLGATLGQACFGGKLGARALVWGALGGILPDLDLAAVRFMGSWSDVLHHRGVTHSLWFGPLVGSLLGYGIWRWHSGGWRREARQAGRAGVDPAPADALHPGGPRMLRPWMGLLVLALLTHPLLDLFTSYGTQLLSPFSNRRFAIDAIAVVDPCYSLVLVSALAFGLVKGVRSSASTRAALAALAITTAYLLYGLVLNERAEAAVREQLAREGIREARVRCYPTLLQIYLRRTVVRTADEVRIGLVSMWKPAPVQWDRFPVSEGPLVRQVIHSRAGRIFDWFSMGQTLPRVEQRDGVVVVEITDLRYGYPMGEAATGLWGIRARFDDNGRMLGRIERFYRDLPRTREMAVELWRDAFGAGLRDGRNLPGERLSLNDRLRRCAS